MDHLSLPQSGLNSELFDIPKFDHEQIMNSAKQDLKGPKDLIGMNVYIKNDYQTNRLAKVNQFKP